jgi:hypothetical protein
MGMAWRRSRQLAWLVALAASIPVVVPSRDAQATVVCQRKKKVKLRVDACKGKETLVEDLAALQANLGTTQGQVKNLVTQLRTECTAAPNLTKASSDKSFYFDNINCGGGCRAFDGNRAGCEGAWTDSEEGATSCFFFKNLCLPCEDCGLRGRACTNACRAPEPRPTCQDATRTQFVGGPNTEACKALTTQASCEMAFHRTRHDTAASCYWTGTACEGCGPNREGNGACTNTCTTGITCADPTRTVRKARCRDVGNDPTMCATAWHVARDEGNVAASCWFDTQETQCKGCGLRQEVKGVCDNVCR